MSINLKVILWLLPLHIRKKKSSKKKIISKKKITPKKKISSKKKITPKKNKGTATKKYTSKKRTISAKKLLAAQKNKVGIIEYGAGNLASNCNAIDFLNFDVKLISNPNDIKNYSHSIVRGGFVFIS